MTWRLEISPLAALDIQRLDRGVQVRVDTMLRRLLVAPRIEHPLSGALAGYFSVEVARRYRIVYSPNQSFGELEVIAVGKRENLEVYRIAAERIANREVETEQRDDPENRTAEPN